MVKQICLWKCLLESERSGGKSCGPRNLHGRFLDSREEYKVKKITSSLYTGSYPRRNLLERKIKRQIKERDRNTSYFHAKVNAHRLKLNRMLLLEEETDSSTDDPTVIHNEAIKHFQCQRESDTSTENNQDLLEVIPNMINKFKNDMIMAFPIHEEVKAVVINLNPLNAPSPDGLTIHFYQAC